MQTLRLDTVAIVSLAGLLFGFDTAVISGVTQALKSTFGLQESGLGLAVSAALWGTFLGALFMGRLGDAIGARDALKLTGALFLVSSIGCALTGHYGVFCLLRFILGIAIGGSSVLAPVYIAEIAPATRRGMLVGLFQLNIVLGILVAYLSNYIVARLVVSETVWRWKLAVPAAPALVFLLLLFTIPHSARWLLAKGRLEEARNSLSRFGMIDLLGAVSNAPADSVRDDARLTWSLHKKPIVLALLLALFNQLTGINAILYYLNDIFAAAGFDRLTSDVQAIVIGITNLLATLVGMSLIDLVGRRQLLVIGAALMAAALAGVAGIMALDRYQTFLLPLLIVFIAAFGASQGAVIWVYLSEIFPTPVRASGQSLGSATHWIANALIAALFPVVAAYTKAVPFAVFAACTLAQCVVVLLYFPETRRISLESMAASL